MFCTKYFLSSIVMQDSLNSCNITCLKKLPKILELELRFNQPTLKLDNYAACCLALCYITNQRATVATSKKPNVFLGIRKGVPVGCYVTLRKKSLHNFLNNFFFSEAVFFSFSLQQNKDFCFLKSTPRTTKFFRAHLYNYKYFKNLPANLNFVLKVGSLSTCANNLRFLLKSLKISNN